ncbi:Microsomal glutathione S-transferase 3 [Smittium mucronatum]|uniref:Microsomal glutathione S-transferase 3 n=1 Tax=Smittium mucronatum TaxID=133383 RepID=A0A1R0GUG8_9FUNG|nr:Microsomal glutathione S-transferase 3 [Smittium mucronatum]
MFSLPDDYAWVLLTVSTMSAQCLIAGMSVFKARDKYNIKYPDMGSGRLSTKLSDTEWSQFNSLNRIHLNYVEQLCPATITTLFSGLFYPIPSSIFGAVYIFGRYLYGKGYSKNGPNGRINGMITFNSALTMNLMVFCFGFYKNMYLK